MSSQPNEFDDGTDADARGAPKDDPFWERFAIVLSVVFLVNVVFLIVNCYLIRFTNKRRLKTLLREEGLLKVIKKDGATMTATEEDMDKDEDEEDIYEEASASTITPDSPIYLRKGLPSTAKQPSPPPSPSPSPSSSSEHIYEEIKEVEASPPTQKKKAPKEEVKEVKKTPAEETKKAERKLENKAERKLEKKPEKKTEKKKKIPPEKKGEKVASMRKDLDAFFGDSSRRVTRSAAAKKEEEEKEEPTTKKKKEKKKRAKDNNKDFLFPSSVGDDDFFRDFDLSFKKEFPMDSAKKKAGRGRAQK